MGHAEDEYSTNVHFLDSDLISIDFKLYGNCCMPDNIDFKFKEDTLSLIYDLKGPPIIDTIWHDEIQDEPEPMFHSIDSITGDSIFDFFYFEPYSVIITEDFGCMCDCCFCFNLVFSELDTTNLTIMGKRNELPYYPEGYKIVPIEFEILDGDTINYSDQYGRRQGKWVKFEKWNNTKTISEHINSECINTIEYEYREDGTLKSEEYRIGWYEIFLKIYYDEYGNEEKRSEFDPPVIL